VEAILAASAILAAACGAPGPASPSAGATLAKRAFDTPYVTVVSGDDGLPVAGAQVWVAGTRWTTDGAGQVPVPVEATASVDVAAEGFLDRQTRLGHGPLTLWPIAPGRGGEYVREIIYRSSAGARATRSVADQPLQRVEAGRVVLLPSHALTRDPAALSACRVAIDEINHATEDRVVFSLGGNTSGAAVFTVDINPQLPWLAGTYKRLRGHVIVGGRIEFASRSGARDARFLAHELGHALGLQHSPSPADLMYFEARAGGARTFTPAERLTVRLLLQRRAGNHYPDNDRDDAVAPLAHEELAAD
jgi:hypothetical protein